MSRSFAENLAAMPPLDGVSGLELSAVSRPVVMIENKAGSQGSLRLYRHLLDKYGVIDAAAAAEGLDLYAEHTQDARLHPGKHPNIDRLLEVVAGDVVYVGRIY
jgi:hypothetical protein